jgi:hypothetical protein
MTFLRVVFHCYSALLYASGPFLLPISPSMTNKVEDDHRDDDGERGGENDTQNSHPHASRGIIKAIKFAQHWRSRSCVTNGERAGRATTP